jgi:hypothetical protein
MITDENFVNATREFDTIERRGSFYNRAVNLIENNFEMEAYFLILATWNFARFRYAVNKFDIEGFEQKIKVFQRCRDPMNYRVPVSPRITIGRKEPALE